MNKLNENLLNCINIFLEIKDTNKLCKVSRFLRDCIKNSNQLRKTYYINLLKKGNKKNFINKNFSNLILTNLELSKITFAIKPLCVPSSIKHPFSFPNNFKAYSEK